MEGSNLTKGHTALLVLAFIILAMIAYVFPLDAPSDALIAWTEWSGSVVGIIVAARVLWAGAALLSSRATTRSGGTG